MPKQNQPEKRVPGTSITETAMERMLRHNREITGPSPIQEGAQQPQVDHAAVAAGLHASQPVLLPEMAAPRIRVNRITERALANAGRRPEGRQEEGVQGTSPSPGQDNIDYVPPTTSNTADPGNVPAEGPDATNQPASRGPSKSERLVSDLHVLFAEGEFPPKNDDDKDDKDDKDGKDGKDDQNGDDDKDDKDKDKNVDKDDEQDIEEAVEVHCENCGYEETYVLSEANIAEGTVPLTPEGQLDSKCPMCGADMDLSMVGATNQGEISDPAPRTDARGNSPQKESVVSPEAITHANSLMRRVVAGESIEKLVDSTINGDFLPRKKRAA